MLRYHCLLSLTISITQPTCFNFACIAHKASYLALLHQYCLVQCIHSSINQSINEAISSHPLPLLSLPAVAGSVLT